MLSQIAVKQLSGLTYRPEAEWLVNVLPVGSVYWADEMPDIRELVHYPEEDRERILRMFSIRLKMWDAEALSDDEKRLWDSICAQVPTWALFRRVSLTEEQKVARQKAEQQVAQEFETLSDSSIEE